MINSDTEVEHNEAEHDEAELPAWARKALASVRTETTKYQLRLAEAERQLRARGLETHEVTLAAYRSKNAELQRTLDARAAAACVGLPEHLATRLLGNTPEELAADARAVAAALFTH